jgi:hypothetical protein
MSDKSKLSSEEPSRPHDRDRKFMSVEDYSRSRGFGPTTGWKLKREGRLPIVHIPGVNRTLVDCERADAELFVPGGAEDAKAPPQPRRRGRPRKSPARSQHEAPAVP